MGTPAASTAVADPTPALLADVRVVLVDRDHARRQLMRYVAQLGSDRLAVVGTADDPDSAIDAVDRFDATAVLLEIQLPVALGLETISALRRDHPALRIVVCSFHKNVDTQKEALERGADSYLLKPLSPKELFAQLRPASLT